MKLALSFDDVLLVPGYNEVPSRSDVSLHTIVAGLPFHIPIIAANMPSVCEYAMAEVMGYVGGLGIIHRMQSIEAQCLQVNQNVMFNTGAAIGIGEDWKDRASCLIDNMVNIICLDVAHGHQKKVLDVALEFLDTFDCSLIIGNIATSYAASHFDKEISEADQHRVALKVGVGGGSVCTTRINTGFGVPTLQSIMDVRKTLDETDSEMSIIADGGIRSSGDIVKAIAAGADAVMLGSLLAGTEEAPGPVLKDDKTRLKYKVYRGAASYGAKKDYFDSIEYVEGAERLIPYKGSVEDVIASLTQGIRSGMTYCGVDNLHDLQEEAEFITITVAGLKESMPHGIL
jgi:IMP dehydrogenase